MDVSIDIETFGTRPGSIIVSIGAISFQDETMSDSFYSLIDIENAQTNGLSFDASTVAWWLKQSDQARVEISKPGHPISSALLDLTSFLNTQRAKDDNNLRLWAKPITFDVVLLEAAYRMTNLTVPWHYREPRDVNTLLECAAFDWRSIPFVGIEHHALHDATHQAKLVMGARRLLRAKD